MPDNPDTAAIAQRVLEFIPPNSVVGLGTGRAATAFIHALGGAVKNGLKVRGIPTSDASANLAKQLGIPLVTFDDVPAIDVCIDGADEVDPAGDLIKGYGGALLREKVSQDSRRSSSCWWARRKWSRRSASAECFLWKWCRSR
jgi:ribose 5-phosphate isomerase A